jgi:hypothetical protein
VKRRVFRPISPRAAKADGIARTATAALTGFQVRDVMKRDPDIGAAWMRISEFVERVALRSDQTVFPVVDADLALAGDLLALVVDGRRIVGIVPVIRLERVIQRRVFACRPRRPRSDRVRWAAPAARPSFG